MLQGQHLRWRNSSFLLIGRSTSKNYSTLITLSSLFDKSTVRCATPFQLVFIRKVSITLWNSGLKLNIGRSTQFTVITETSAVSRILSTTRQTPTEPENDVWRFFFWRVLACQRLHWYALVGVDIVNAASEGVKVVSAYRRHVAVIHLDLFSIHIRNC